jgi:hypothetical protein
MVPYGVFFFFVFGSGWGSWYKFVVKWLIRLNLMFARGGNEEGKYREMHLWTTRIFMEWFFFLFVSLYYLKIEF